MRIIKVNKAGIELALKYLRQGKSVVYPTDTAYGLGVDATNVRAVKKLLQIKERKNQPVHIVVSSLAMAKKFAVFTPLAVKLFKKFLPGPLTLILSRRGRGSYKEAFKLLSAGTGTIGIRMPADRIALELSRKLGRPITTPSANPSAHLSGGTTPYSVQDSYEQFEGKKYQPDLFLDGGKLSRSKPSTLVKISNNKIHILRKGPITKRQIMSVIAIRLGRRSNLSKT